MKIAGAEVRPHAIAENQLGVGALPEQKIAEPLLTAGADQNIHGRRFTEQYFKSLARHVLTGRSVTGGDNGVARRIIDCQPEVKPIAPARQPFRLID